ncbi:hypothetical protein G9C85_00930 [Halorubellus sp. JP-L1]|uniref:DUF7504 family protein n=1 Tax=Halorubellus sp. JP-L1 TaxID=2715753 RepID=UPI00140E305B|nr:hypothetical protein [Halorubellus sp. JP-L1]NHN40199.1 hypothetical protein [Halorubellus sp. JP-L1]
MRTDHGGGVPDSTAFAQTLSSLKQEGSNILLVGRTSGSAHQAACERLLGDGEELRRRVYVYTAENEACGFTATAPGPDDSACIVAQETADGDDDGMHDAVPSSIERTVVGNQLLASLGAETIDAVAAYDDEFDLAPAELRLCFDSVTPLLRDHKSENVFRLLHMVTSRVREVDGMGHFHLPLGRDSDYVHLLEPLFDAIVEVRDGDDGLQQRWDLRDRGADTGWIEL